MNQGNQGNNAWKGGRGRGRLGYRVKLYAMGGGGKGMEMLNNGVNNATMCRADLKMCPPTNKSEKIEIKLCINKFPLISHLKISKPYQYIFTTIMHVNAF